MQSVVMASNLMAVARESESIYVITNALLQARAVSGSDHIMASCELSHACRLLTWRIAELRRIVTEVDREVAGTEVGSLVELGLRAQTAAILLVFDELYCALRDDSTRFADLYTGRLHTIEDVIGYVFDALSRANRSWVRCRGELRAVDEGSVPKAIEATRAPVLYLAMRRAQRAIAALNADPDFAHFLRVGATLTDVPEVRLACDQLAQLLAFNRIRELDPELLLAAAVLEPEQLLDLGGGRGGSSAPDGEAMTFASSSDDLPLANALELTRSPRSVPGIACPDPHEGESVHGRNDATDDEAEDGTTTGIE